MDAFFQNDGSHVGEAVMIKTKAEFLQRLKFLLHHHPDEAAIVAEIEGHMDELIKECGLPEQEAITIVQSQIGTPEELTSQFRYVSSKEFQSTKKMFIIVNILFFTGGGLLALGTNFSVLLHMFWEVLVQSSWIILIGYSGYWAFMGYEIGKEYGAKGESLLRRTMGAAIVPNILLMIITLLGILPSELFHSLLQSSFLIGCLTATAFFFPISKAGYYIGVRKVFD